MFWTRIIYEEKKRSAAQNHVAHRRDERVTASMFVFLVATLTPPPRHLFHTSQMWLVNVYVMGRSLTGPR